MHLAGLGVESEVFEAKYRAVDVTDVVAAQEGAQPRQQLGQIEGLDEIVVGADVETLDSVVHRVARGQHQDRRRVTRATNPPTHFEAVDVG